MKRFFNYTDGADEQWIASESSFEIHNIAFRKTRIISVLKLSHFKNTVQ